MPPKTLAADPHAWTRVLLLRRSGILCQRRGHRRWGGAVFGQRPGWKSDFDAEKAEFYPIYAKAPCAWGQWEFPSVTFVPECGLEIGNGFQRRSADQRP